MIRARDLSPDHPTAYTYLGKIYLKHKDFKAAKEAFQTSIQINPFNPEVHLGLAEAYEMLGEKSDGSKEREIARKLMLLKVQGRRLKAGGAKFKSEAQETHA